MVQNYSCDLKPETIYKFPKPKPKPKPFPKLKHYTEKLRNLDLNFKT